MSSVTERQLAALDTLEKSLGWQLVLEHCDARLREMSMQLANQTIIADSEVHYARGAMLGMSQISGVVAAARNTISMQTESLNQTLNKQDTPDGHQ